MTLGLGLSLYLVLIYKMPGASDSMLYIEKGEYLNTGKK